MGPRRRFYPPRRPHGASSRRFSGAHLVVGMAKPGLGDIVALLAKAKQDVARWYALGLRRYTNIQRTFPRVGRVSGLYESSRDFHVVFELRSLGSYIHITHSAARSVAVKRQREETPEVHDPPPHGVEEVHMDICLNFQIDHMRLP
jgi:hypothetical protein